MSIVQGSKGPKGGGSQRTPVEAANTLRSTSKGRILDLIVHGPIQGLADGLKSVFLDDTQLQNADGSFNFEGVSVVTREGYPDQEIIPGFRAVENPHDVSTEVKFGAPVVRALTNQDADAVVVSIRLNSLSKQDRKTGDLNGHSVSVSIQTRLNGGGWSTAVTDNISGKTTSAYQRSYRVDLPTTGAWEVRVLRNSADEANSYAQSSTFWSDMTEVVDARLNYPDSALVGLEVDAKLFGNQMPSRSYDMKLSIIKVPSNYNPITRAYTGIWNGAFKLAWTDNPAWCYYDLATHPVIGAGLTGVDKWALYQIGRYCDELVPDGFGGTEPRFTLNTLFAERTEAITTLTTLASVFRGMTYWGTNTVVPVGDQPTDPRKLVGPANVVNGEFEYSGTSLKERHSVAIVMWNDPADSGKAKPELVEDPESIDLFGWKEVTVTAFGCTSRGQANRLGRWILYSERMETETVAYTAVSDQADVRPGDIVEISDPDRAGARLSGRVITPGLSTLVLDKAPAEASGSSWFVSVMMADGTVQRRGVTSFSGNTVGLASPLPSLPIPGAMWTLSSLSVVPPQYRVASVSEQEDGATYAIIATEYDPRKYQIVEQGLTLAEIPHSLIPVGPLAPALDITAEVYTYLAGGTEHQGLSVSWTPNADVRTTHYIAEVQGPADVKWRTAHSGPGISFDEKDAPPGEWMIRVRAMMGYNVGSAWAARTVNIAGLLLPVAPDTVDVFVNTFDITLRPRGAYPGAMYEFWRSSVALADAMIESNAVLLSVSTDLVDVGLKSATQYFYYIRGANAYGRSTWYPVQGTTKANFDDILNALDTDIRKPGGLFEEMVGEASSGVTAIVQGEVTAALTDVRTELDAVHTDIGALEVGVSSLTLTNQLGTIRHLASLALHEGSSARSSTEEVVRATENSALAAQITLLEATVSDDISAALTVEQLARASADSALAAQITSLEATVNDDISAALTVEQLARANADSALSSQITTVSAASSAAQTTAEGKGKVLYQTATPAVADRLSQNLWVDTTGGANTPKRWNGSAWVAVTDKVATDAASAAATNAAALTSEQTARANADSALASQITTLSSNTGSQFASVQQQFTAQSSYTEGAVARALTTVTVNGKKAVFGISSDGVVAEIGAVADRFYVYNPLGGTYTLAFAVVNGQTVIQDAMIRDASIGSAKIADASITAAKIADATITSAEIANAAITNAKIASLAVSEANIIDASVKTLKIGLNSVTIPVAASTTGSIWAGMTKNLVTTVQSLSFQSIGEAIILTASYQHQQANIELWWSILEDGVAIASGQLPRYYYGYLVPTSTLSLSLNLQPPAGSHTYALTISCRQSGVSGTLAVDNRYLGILGCKR